MVIAGYLFVAGALLLFISYLRSRKKKTEENMDSIGCLGGALIIIAMAAFLLMAIASNHGPKFRTGPGREVPGRFR